ncbi:MAG: CHASE2 and HATPase_c domain-containing protein [Proteobacteria bacterium]|nr:CHASE2 and HATPase_c domain-containing protein [Pseudomonadota bacterium]
MVREWGLVPPVWLQRVAGIGLAVLLVILQLLNLPPFLAMRNGFFDLEQRIFERPLPAGPVTIVDIDESSIMGIGQWPWPRNRIAELITALALDDTAVAGLSIIFSEPDRLSPENVLRDFPMPQELIDRLRVLPSNDTALAASMALVPTVLTSGVIPEEQIPSETRSRRTPVELRLGLQSSARLRQYPALLNNLPQLEAAGAGSGVASVELDPDGIIRRLPAVMLINEAIVPSFAVEIVRIFRGAAAIGVAIDGPGISGLTIGSQIVPTDTGGSIWLRQVSSAGFKRLSAVDVLLGNHEPEDLEGRIVILGATGTGLERSFVTTGGELLSALDLQALYVENLLSDIFLTRSEVVVFFEILATLAGCLGIVLLHGRLRFYLGQFAVFAYLILLIGGSLYGFSAHRILFDPSFTVLSVVVCYLAFIGMELVRTQRERRQTAQERTTALMLAEAASRSKTNFLANMSHELRTPLNAILGFSEMIKDGVLGPANPAQYGTYARDIHNSAAHLLGMVTQILSMAELESGEGHLRVSDFDLRDAITESIGTIRNSQGLTGAKIEFDAEAPMPRLRADRKMVTQILLNLLQNAVKF